MKKSYIAPEASLIDFVEPLTPLCQSFDTDGTTEDVWSNKRDFTPQQEQKHPIWSNMQ